MWSSHVLSMLIMRGILLHNNPILELLSSVIELTYCGFQSAKTLWKHFGSEIVAACIAVELIEGLCYKLCMFNIPIDGPANMYCDNSGVVINCTKPCHIVYEDVTKQILISLSCVRHCLRTTLLHFLGFPFFLLKIPF
jgi:hypothetical protein